MPGQAAATAVLDDHNRGRTAVAAPSASGDRRVIDMTTQIERKSVVSCLISEYRWAA